jgi:HlyD family secretion protein
LRRLAFGRRYRAVTWSGNYGDDGPVPHGANVGADRAIGPQGAALVYELRRLQKALDQERYQELEQFPDSVQPLPANRRFDSRRGVRGWSARSAIDGAVDLCLGMLGLNRRTPVGREATSRPRAGTVASRRSARRRTTEALWQPMAERPEKREQPPTTAKIKGHDARQAEVHTPIEEPSRLYLLGRRGDSDTLWAAVDAGLAPLRSGYNFLVRRARGDGVDDKSDAELATGLTCAFEGELRTGLRVLIVGVGIFGTWATLVPLSGAVVVPGTLVVESNVKKIQHPTGGVVARIPVHDGMQVHAGELVLRLDETQARARYQVLIQQLNQVRVRLARLVAERDGMDEPKLPQEIVASRSEDGVRRLWASEVSLFNSRAATRRSAKELLRSHIGQLKEQISGLDAQLKSKAAQHDLISGELEGVESLYQKGLVPLTRKASLQREAARLDGDRGQVAAAIAEAKSKISEAELQIIRIDQDFRTEVMKDLREAQDKEAELVEKSIAAQDLLRQLDLRAPTSGIIQQLSVHTVGGVILPGEVIMEIVPESDALQIEARLPPRNIDQVRSGQRSYVRFSVFNQSTTPQLEGVVSYVSADLSHDRRSNAAYYTVRVTLPNGERRRLGNLQLVSGMPVEVFLQTGSRTMMSYLLKPISDQLQRTFSER